MELSKSNVIFNIIDKHTELINLDNKCYIYFKNDNTIWTEAEYNNFINVMRSSGYKEEIEKEYLEESTDDRSMIIHGYNNIIKYCISNNIKQSSTIWNNKKTIVNDTVDNLFNSKLEFNVINTNKVELPHSNWKDIRKAFKINKKIVYTDVTNNTKYIVNICKTSDNDETYYNFKSSSVMKSHQKYEFILDITNTPKDKIISTIIKMEQAIHLSAYILSKPQQKKIIDDYYSLIKDDVYVRPFNFNINKPPLLTPKPVTLEKENLQNPDEYGTISILSEYTVTEKADGERILLYINGSGKVYLINNTYRVDDTGLIASKELFNSLIDGEYIPCKSRKDNSSSALYASFDIYYYGGKKVTNLPLIDDKESRYNYLLETNKLIKSTTGSIDYIVKNHLYNKKDGEILKNCKKILNKNTPYLYDIDGLIFTPAKLSVYGYYANRPVQISDNMKWDRVFKWKPAEQNTIDFLVKEGRTLNIEGQKYKEMFLYVGYNAEQWEDYTIGDAIRTRYDKEYRNAKKEKKKDRKKNYVPKLFKPTIYYTNGIEKAHVKIRANGEIVCEDGSKVQGDSIVEFKYILDESIPVSMRWRPLRVREDKTRIYNQGELSKTANDLGVAINIWSSIHNPVTEAMIIGNEPISLVNENEDKLLETEDIYYSRNIPREALLSYHMHQFHNQGIKSMLYTKPKVKGSLVELACGQGGDMSRWFNNGYKFILGIDLVKNNIYNPRSGAYSRMLNGRNNFVKKVENSDKLEFTDMVFAVGDCSKNIITGDCSKNIIKDINGNYVDDKDSVNLLKIIFNKKNSGEEKYYSHVAGMGLKKFDACSCMFSTHYFFKSEETLNGFLKNVSSLLKKDGVFFCTFMDGKSVENALNETGGDIVEGKKKLYDNLEDDKNTQPTWAIIRRYNQEYESMYNKKIDVFIESTNRFIPEYIVHFETLVEKCKEFNLEIEETEMFSETFNKIKDSIPDKDNITEQLHKDIMILDKDDIQKKFSFLNRWCIFKKI